MKKTSRIIALVVALGCAFSAVSMAAGDGTSHMGKKAKNVKKAAGKIKIDAKSKDKAWKKATSFKATDFVWAVGSGEGVGMALGKSAVKKITSKDTKAKKIAYPKTLKVTWDKSWLYVYMEVSDKTQQNIFPYNDYNTDSVEYYIDAKDTNKALTDANKSAAQYTLARNGKGYTGWGSKNLARWKKSVKTKDTKAAYTHEVKIKFSDHGVANMKVGKKIGFDIQINDSTTGKTRDYNVVWNSLDNAWTNAATMGTIKLVK